MSGGMYMPNLLETEEAVGRWAKDFRRAMTDVSQFGPAKALGNAMLQTEVVMPLTECPVGITVPCKNSEVACVSHPGVKSPSRTPCASRWASCLARTSTLWSRKELCASSRQQAHKGLLAARELFGCSVTSASM